MGSGVHSQYFIRGIFQGWSGHSMKKWVEWQFLLDKLKVFGKNQVSNIYVESLACWWLFFLGVSVTKDRGSRETEFHEPGK